MNGVRRSVRVRALAVGALVSVSLVLGGCATGVAESRVAEFEGVGTELAAEIVGSIPAGLEAQPALALAEVRDGGPGIEAATDSVWWQYEQDIELVERDGASVEAAEEIARSLQADGWEMRRVRETEQGQRVADGFRRLVDDQGWYIELTYMRTSLPMAQRIELILVSPATVRGEAQTGNAGKEHPVAHTSTAGSPEPYS